MENLRRDLFYRFFCYFINVMKVRLFSPNFLIFSPHNTHDGVICSEDVYISLSFSLKMDSITGGFLQILANSSIFCKILKVRTLFINFYPYWVRLGTCVNYFYSLFLWKAIAFCVKRFFSITKIFLQKTIYKK